MVNTAQQYLCGLIQADKRNMERMAEAVPDSDDQVLQNFLTHSSWEYRGVMNRVARKADESVGAEVGTGLYIDESAFQKKGDRSRRRVINLSVSRVNGMAASGSTKIARWEFLAPSVEETESA